MVSPIVTFPGLVLAMSIPDLWGSHGWWTGAALFAWMTLTVWGSLRRQDPSPVGPLLFGGGSLLLLIGVCGGGTHLYTLPLPLFLGDAAIRGLVDPLSRWFLGLIALVGLPLALFAPGYLGHLRARIALGGLWASLALLAISMVGVVLAANALTFLVAWELMALASFLLVIADHQQQAIRRAAFVYLGATRIGTAFLMAGFLWAHQRAGSWDFADWGASGALALGPALLILVGLATKAGCWPFHLWLPIAHPAAPAPVSAIMSGVMLKTAIYAMLRLFVVSDHPVPAALGTLLLILGAISALWGILFGLLQRDLKRMLAYSSVENIGLIVMGIGLAVLGRHLALPLLTQLGLATALLHALNHAVFKSLLFLSVGAVDAQAHTRDQEKLGGLLKQMPWTGAAFLVGSAAICALPPFNGFASEWFLYQGFFTLATAGPTASVRLAGLLLMGWLALVGALALACFVKAVGIAFLGLPRTRAAAQAREVGPGMRLAQVGLASLCLLLGMGVPALLGPVSRIAAPLGGGAVLRDVWRLPVTMVILGLALALLVLGAGLALLARRRPTRRFITWECGFGPLTARMQYTATSFSQPIIRLFGAIYRYGLEIAVEGRDRRHFPETVRADSHHEVYLETRVYAPLLRAIQRMAGGLLMRLQAGSIHQYLLMMAVALILLLAMGYRP
jgi:hydrogenase-4 component B